MRIDHAPAIFSAVALVAMAGFTAGHAIGERHGRQHINELLSVGFTLTDPEGYEIAAYDVPPRPAAEVQP